MSRATFLGLCGLVVSVSLAGSAAALELGVDFGTTDSPIQAGYSQFGRGLSSPNHNIFGPQIENFSGITVTIDGTSGTGWRNRAVITGPFAGLSDLLGDEVKSNGSSSDIGDSLFLTLGGLQAGTWEITTYHHSGRTNPSGSIDIFLVGNPVALVSDLVQSVGTAPSEIATATLTFASDGISNVVFEYREKAVIGGGAEAVLSGFELTFVPATAPIPEPASFLLVAGLSLGATCFHRRAGLRRRENRR